MNLASRISTYGKPVHHLSPKLEAIGKQLFVKADSRQTTWAVGVPYYDQIKYTPTAVDIS